MYSGNLVPVESFLYSGAEPLKPMPDHRDNDFPSDHFALITEFDLLFPQYGINANDNLLFREPPSSFTRN